MPALLSTSAGVALCVPEPCSVLVNASSAEAIQSCLINLVGLSSLNLVLHAIRCSARRTIVPVLPNPSYLHRDTMQCQQLSRQRVIRHASIGKARPGHVCPARTPLPSARRCRMTVNAALPPNYGQVSSVLSVGDNAHGLSCIRCTTRISLLQWILHGPGIGASPQTCWADHKVIMAPQIRSWIGCQYGCCSTVDGNQGSSRQARQVRAPWLLGQARSSRSEDLLDSIVATSAQVIQPSACACLLDQGSSQVCQQLQHPHACRHALHRSQQPDTEPSRTHSPHPATDHGACGTLPAKHGARATLPARHLS